MPKAVTSLRFDGLNVKCHKSCLEAPDEAAVEQERLSPIEDETHLLIGMIEREGTDLARDLHPREVADSTIVQMAEWKVAVAPSAKAKYRI